MDEVYSNLTTKLAEVLFSAPGKIELSEEAVAESKKQAVWLNVAPGAAVPVQISNLRVLAEHAALHKLLSDAGIPYVILKGCASASYYPRPMERTMGDVDFLVNERDREHTDALLLQNGYEVTEKTNPYHWGYRHNGIVAELHWRINGEPEGEAGECVRKYMSTAIQEARLCAVSGQKMMLPSDFHHGLIILLHMARHMTSSGLGLRHLCDWAVFVNRVADFEATFRAPLEEIGVWKYACQMTAVCRQYLQLPGAEWAGEYPDEYLEAIMDDVCEAGNFGRKKGQNRNQRYESAFLGSIATDTDANKRSKLRNLFAYLTNFSYVVMPISKKWKFLVPFGSAFVIVRYLWRVATGKRPMAHLFGTASGAEKRREIYRQFKLFEKE